MILKITEPEICISNKNRQWRWVLSCGLFFIHLEQETSFNGGETWKSSYRHFIVELIPLLWEFGSDQNYYDGMWYFISIGPLKINWYD